ncbi:MAG: DMT family transporter [Betaproteobacteria bacterium]
MDDFAGAFLHDAVPSMKQLSTRAALGLFAAVIFAWGFNWPVAKLTLQEGVTPLWMATIRSALAAAVLLVLMIASRNLRLPRKGDWPIVLGITLLHMVGYAALIAIALQFLPAGRSVVLGYTHPLWVVPGAILFLGERLTPARAFGVLTGLGGIALLFNPLEVDWHNGEVVLGNGLLMLASVCWAASILQIRAHKWISTPFQLVFWEVLLATILLAVLALLVEGTPSIEWTPRLAVLFGYGSVFGVALAYWAMAMVNRGVPAVTTSLGILATPAVGIATSMIVLDEPFNATLLIALLMIVGGIALAWKRRDQNLHAFPSQ